MIMMMMMMMMMMFWSAVHKFRPKVLFTDADDRR